MSIASVPGRAAPKNAVHHTALQAIAAGMSVVPIRSDGTKQPALTSWREYQQRRASIMELAQWFCSADERGIALITGSVSGNLEALDFDCYQTFDAWVHMIQRDVALSPLFEHLSRGYLEATPAGGRHLLYRCQVIEGNQKLASCPDGDRRKTLIETRGEGGLIIVAPSRGKVHASGKPYMLLRGGVSSIRTITTHQRMLLFSAARAFDRMPPIDLSLIPPRKAPRFEHGTEAPRPGDLFNQHASWEEVLLPHGWQLVQVANGEGHWRRPGKRGFGISATTNYQGHDMLYVFSTSTVFEAECGYTKFSAYTFLNHNGDFSAAARDLAERGYTTQKEKEPWKSLGRNR